MATITKRKTGWLVQIRRKGFNPQSKTFDTKTAATAWARGQEAQRDQGHGNDNERTLKAITLGSLVDRYLREVTPSKLSAPTETQRLTKLRKHPMCDVNLADLTPGHLANYRDERLLTIRPGTIRREFGLLQHMIDIAAREWGLPIDRNPVKKVTLPPLRNTRERRLRAGEDAMLRSALSSTRNQCIAPIVFLAIETGLRRRELLELTWAAIDLDRRTAHIPVTKTGVPRTIPLTDQTITILSGLPRSGGRVFPVTMNAFKLAWRRVQERAGLTDLRFHDLRHEALSRFCEMGLTIPELAVISGHKDPRMLFRYAHLRADQLAMKLAGRTWEQSVCSMGDRA